jgi:hypothetical protein
VQFVLVGIGKVRVGPPDVVYPPPTRLGAPNGLAKFWLARVSTTRHGVIGMNARELAGADPFGARPVINLVGAEVLAPLLDVTGTTGTV